MPGLPAALGACVCVQGLGFRASRSGHAGAWSRCGRLWCPLEACPEWGTMCQVPLSHQAQGGWVSCCAPPELGQDLCSYVVHGLVAVALPAGMLQEAIRS